MRRAFDREIIRAITRSLGRFIAILAIVGLGAGFYAGLRMCSPDMRLTLDRYFDETAFMDVHIVSTLGFSDADVEAVRGVPGVSGVMGTRIADATATIGDRRTTVRIHGLDVEAAAASDTSDGARALSEDTDYLNRPILVEGRWPRASGECVIDRNKVYADSARVGDTVTLTEGVRDLGETFARTDFTVVGMVDSSYYLAFSRGTTPLESGFIDRVLWIPETDFAEAGVYTDLFVTVEGAAATAGFTADYDDAVDPVESRLASLATTREGVRLAEVKAEAQEALAEKREEYERAEAEVEAELADAAGQLDEATRRIDSTAARLADARRAYERGLADLAREREAFEQHTAEAQAAIDDGRVQLAAQETQLEELAGALSALELQMAELEGQVSALEAAYEAALAAETAGEVVTPSSAEIAAQLTGVRQLLAEAQAAYDLQSGKYDEGVAAVAAAHEAFAENEAELDAGRQQAAAQFASAERELATAKREIASGESQLAEARSELEAAREEYVGREADARAELADARSALDEAQREIEGIEQPTWYVLGRDTNLGHASFTADADRIDAISLVFPLIFFLVAALVALTTMTRMVDEERTLIGTHKALGYGPARIASKYLAYAGIASVTGAVIGIIVGSQTLPVTIWNAYTTMYTAPPLLTPIHVSIALSAGVGAVGVTLLATLAAVTSTLRESPAALMLPKAPRPGRRILLERVKPLWSRLSFSQKVTARNLFRYKKRLFMTVIGIAGCTALLLTGFGLKDSISDILDKQYGDLYRYNITVGLDPDDIAERGGAEGGALSFFQDDPRVESYLPMRVESVRITNEAGLDASGGVREADSYTTRLTVPGDPADVGELIILRDRLSGAPVPLGEAGVILSEKVARELGLSAGDTVYAGLLDAAGGSATEAAVPFTVTGVAEHYVNHHLYITPGLYERTFGEAPVYNQVVATVSVADEAAEEALSRELLGRDGITIVQYTDDITSSFDDMLHSLNAVVLVLIVAAGALAFVVLYNLTNINVTERTREIATIKVLGFYDHEVDAYIYRETAALTALGCALGLLLGIGLEAFVIKTVEIDVVMFGREIHPPSFVWSVALTAVFAIIVNLAMRRRLRGIDMVESLKSVE